MEIMLTGYDYLMINHVERVSAIDVSSMHVDPDKKEERRRQEREGSFARNRRESLFLKEKEEAMRVKQSQSPPLEREVRNEDQPFHLWLQMAGRARVLTRHNEVGAEEDGRIIERMEIFLQEQEKVLLRQEEREGRFRAKA